MKIGRLALILGLLVLTGCYQVTGTVDGGIYRVNSFSGTVSWCKRAPKMGTDDWPITCYDQAGNETR